MDGVIKKDLKRVSQMDTDNIMDLLGLDGEDSAEAVKSACAAYVRSNLGRNEKIRKTEFGGFGRKSARVVKGGSAW